MQVTYLCLVFQLEVWAALIKSTLSFHSANNCTRSVGWKYGCCNHLMHICIVDNLSVLVGYVPYPNLQLISSCHLNFTHFQLQQRGLYDVRPSLYLIDCIQLTVAPPLAKLRCRISEKTCDAIAQIELLWYAPPSVSCMNCCWILSSGVQRTYLAVNWTTDKVLVVNGMEFNCCHKVCVPVMEKSSQHWATCGESRLAIGFWWLVRHRMLIFQSCGEQNILS